VRKDNIDKLAAEYAKEIVVAKAQQMDLRVNADGGRNVAAFYSEIFKGISETLNDSNLITE
jgi:hypothetical protein